MWLCAHKHMHVCVHMHTCKHIYAYACTSTNMYNAHVDNWLHRDSCLVVNVGFQAQHILAGYLLCLFSSSMRVVFVIWCFLVSVLFGCVVDDLPPIAAASMWTRKDIKDFKDSLRRDKDSVIKIGSGETVTVSIFLSVSS